MHRRLQMALALCLTLVVTNGHAAGVANLSKSCKNMTPKDIQEILASGVDVNAPSLSSETPLMRCAKENDNPEVINTLVNAGAKVCAKNRNGYTALMVAATNSNNPAISALLQARDQINCLNSRESINGKLGRTALGLINSKNLKGKNLLLQAGATP